MSEGQVIKRDEADNCFSFKTSQFCFNFGSNSRVALVPYDSISPDGDLVRMWAAWVREDETLPPTAQARH